MDQRKNQTPIKLSRTKSRVFHVLAALLPIVFLIIIECVLRLFHAGGNQKLFIPTPVENSVYLGINTEISKRYFNSGSFNPTPRKDLFLKEKPDNCFRIFVLGGSTTAGFPYGNNLTFPRILQRRLSDVFPDRRIEVINTAFTAINSYTLLDFMDEILAHEPDLLLIYAGHNEYFGALGVASMESLGRQRWVIKTALYFQKSRLGMLLRKLISGIKKQQAPGDETDDPMQTEMARIVKDKEIPCGSALRKAGIEQFKKNLRAIMKKADRAGVPLIISELVSNVGAQPPFVSIRQDTYPEANTIYQKAQVLAKDGKYAAAAREFYRAKDLDALPFRAPEEFNDVIHQCAVEFDVQVVPMKSYFEAASPNGIIGLNLIHEHLHPNIDGYFLMADAFFRTIKDAGYISSQWPDKVLLSTNYRLNWGITALDTAYAALNVAHLKGGWPFKTSGPNLFLNHFQAKTKEDSIALNILTNPNMTLELGHISLAEQYSKAGQNQKAFREYRALIYTVPFLDLFYEPTLKFLLDNNRHDLALQLLTDALKYNQSAFIREWLGNLHLAFNHTDLGISYLENVRAETPYNLQLLFNLGRAYFKSSQFMKGNRILGQLQRISPNSPYSNKLEKYKQSLLEGTPPQ